MKQYESFFHDVIDGKYGSTVAYWAIYVYLINRVYRELKRAVSTNDVEGYILGYLCLSDQQGVSRIEAGCEHQ